MYHKLSTSLLAEFIGTFALIFIGAGAGALNAGLVAVAFAHGLVVLGFAYAYGHISGTHVNPAVTLGVWVAGKIDAARAGTYIVFQILGGIAGALTLRWVLGGTGLTVSVLCPGPTETGFQRRAGMENSWLFSGLLRVADAASVARAGYDGFRAGKRVVIPGLLNKVGVQSIRATPRALATKVIKKMQERRH
jgi:hypothetical protein